MNVEKMMTHDVECISPSATTHHAAERMKVLNVGSLPVCEDDRLVGMVTDRDITIRGTANQTNPRDFCVRDVMTPNVFFCFEDDDVTEAARIMEEHQIRRLPVLSRQKRLVGIISLGDIAVRTGDEALSGEALRCVSEPTSSAI
jgi:CBS domain-containing protein